MYSDSPFHAWIPDGIQGLSTQSKEPGMVGCFPRKTRAAYPSLRKNVSAPGTYIPALQLPADLIRELFSPAWYSWSGTWQTGHFQI